MSEHEDEVFDEFGEESSDGLEVESGVTARRSGSRRGSYRPARRTTRYRRRTVPHSYRTRWPIVYTAPTTFIRPVVQPLIVNPVLPTQQQATSIALFAGGATAEFATLPVVGRVTVGGASGHMALVTPMFPLNGATAVVLLDNGNLAHVAAPLGTHGIPTSPFATQPMSLDATPGITAGPPPRVSRASLVRHATMRLQIAPPGSIQRWKPVNYTFRVPQTDDTPASNWYLALGTHGALSDEVLYGLVVFANGRRTSFVFHQPGPGRTVMRFVQAMRAGGLGAASVSPFTFALGS